MPDRGCAQTGGRVCRCRPSIWIRSVGWAMTRTLRCMSAASSFVAAPSTTIGRETGSAACGETTALLVRCLPHCEMGGGTSICQGFANMPNNFDCCRDGTHNHSTPPRLVNISGDVTVHNPTVTTCNADFGNPSLGLSPDVTVTVACNPKPSRRGGSQMMDGFQSERH